MLCLVSSKICHTGDRRSVDRYEQVARDNTRSGKRHILLHIREFHAAVAVIVVEAHHIPRCHRRFICDRFLFPVGLFNLQRNLIRRHALYRHHRVQLFSDGNMSSLIGSDDISRFQACLCLRRTVCHFCDARRGTSRVTDHKDCAEKCQNHVEHRSRHNDGNSCPHGFAVKGSFPLLFTVLAEHLARTAERQKF